MTICPHCQAEFVTMSSRDRHRVYNSAHDNLWDFWCLSGEAMQTLGMRQDWKGKWYVPADIAVPEPPAQLVLA